MILAGLVLGGSALLAGCGGDLDVKIPLVATTDLVVPIDATTGPSVVAAVLGKRFDFATGVADFGTIAPTSLTFSKDAAAPSFAIQSGTDSATGVMNFGSCKYNVNASTWVAPHPLSKDSEIIVTACELQVETKGKGAGDNTEHNTTAGLKLGVNLSAKVSAIVVIASDGGVILNGKSIGSVSVVPATGAGS